MKRHFTVMDCRITYLLFCSESLITLGKPGMATAPWHPQLYLLLGQCPEVVDLDLGPRPAFKRQPSESPLHQLLLTKHVPATLGRPRPSSTQSQPRGSRDQISSKGSEGILILLKIVATLLCLYCTSVGLNRVLKSKSI